MLSQMLPDQKCNSVDNDIVSGKLEAVGRNQCECALCQFSGGKGSEAVATWAKANVIGSWFLNPDPA